MSELTNSHISPTTPTTIFNIVSFIETNPIARISSDYNSRILAKIKENFTEEEQKLYISSFYCYLNYDSKQDFIIDLDNIWHWLGFNNKFNSKRVLSKNFIENIDYKISHLSLEERYEHIKGGENKETILLTINAFKKLCLKAGTKKADDVHNYFIKMEEIMHEVIKEESEELKQQLENAKIEKAQLENQTIEMDSEIKNLKRTNELDKHDILCQQYDKQLLVYVLKMETLPNGHFIIKIGETQDIKQRCQAISADFGLKVLIMDLFPCDLNYKFEQFLHRQPIMIRHKYTGIINNIKKSTETYLVSGMADYNKIKQFIQRNIVNFYSKNPEHTRVALIKCMTDIYKDYPEKLDNALDKVLQIIQHTPQQSSTANISHQVDQMIDSDNDNHQDQIANTFIETNIQEPASKPNTYSPKVQIYDPTDLTKVVRVFDSITEATRAIEGTSYTHIKYASRHKTIYKNYRWNLIASVDLAPYVAKPIGATVETTQRRTGFVARLNLEKNKVLQVFTLQKEAAKECNTHTSLICTAIRYGSALCGSFWVLWDDLDAPLREDYLKTNEPPKVQSKARGSAVQQINPHTGELEREYLSITDATKAVKVSVNSIKKSSAEDVAVNGWKWKIL